MEERDRAAFAKAGPYAVFGAFRLLGMMVGALPMPLTRAVFTLAGMAAFAVAKGRRETVKENMRRIRPGAGEREVRLLAMKSFVNYAHYWIDFLNSLYITPDRIFRTVVPHGTDNFDIAREKGRGAILALPHYGSWELEGGIVGMKHMDFWAVAEVLEPPPMFRYHTRLRNRMGIKIIPLSENTVGEVIQVLLNNGLVCLLSDRVVAGSGVEVDFFGGKAEFPVGPALLALKLGTTVLPCHTIRKGRHFHGYVGPPLEIENTGNTRADVQANMQKLARIYEEFIREDPEQWHMFQPIWKD
jgi:phosphatidylinositol dimannoside acyltransferase